MDSQSGRGATPEPELNELGLNRETGSIGQFTGRGLIDLFLEYSKDAPSPVVFRKWAAIQAIGAAAERRIWTSLGINRLHPNLFIFLVGPPGVGKCLAPETPVLKFDGTVVQAQTIRDGDVLVGPDSKPRIVSNCHWGEAEMFEVHPSKGMYWKCNGDHIMSLRKSRQPNQGSIRFVTVREWISWSDWHKSEWKLWRTGVDFAEQQLSIDPYFVGLVLGDGSVANGINVTTDDPEIVSHLSTVADAWELEVVKYDNSLVRCPRYGLVSRKGWRTNRLLDTLRMEGLSESCGDKFVPSKYKTGSRKQRLEVLAGLLDTDGSYVVHANCFDFISKSKQLAEDVAFLSNSLDMFAAVKPCLKSATNSPGHVGQYYRVTISGDVAQIPCKLPRKQARKREMIKANGNQGFDIDSVGHGKFYGFEVDGDHQFLLGDFTVTHNSQAINPMAIVLRKSGACGLAPTDMTKQGLLDALKTNQKGALVEGIPFDYHYMSINISELSNFMSQYDHALAGLLTDLFDCPPINEEQKRGMGDKSVSIAFPGISFIMGSATKNLGATISDDMWGSGFMARVIMVYSCEEIIPEDMFAKPEDNTKLVEELALALRRIGQLKGEMRWEKTAQAKLRDFRVNQRDGAPLHNRLDNYVTRRWLHLAKLCMIVALSDERMVVEEEDFDMALSWLIEAEAQMPEIFKDMVGHEDGQVFEELRHHLFGLYMKSGRKPIPRSVIIAWLVQRSPGYAVERMLAVAEAADYIRRMAGTSDDDAAYIPQAPTGAKNTGVI